MKSLPTGTVTFLFTDIEGSTALLQRLGDRRYAEVLEEHRRLLRDAFAKGNGQEVDTQGDAFLVAFPRARDAVAAAVATMTTMISAAGTTVNVIGSAGDRPSSTPAMVRASTIPPATPKTSPMRPRRAPSRIRCATTPRGVNPNAIRTPISRVRSATLLAITA